MGNRGIQALLMVGVIIVAAISAVAVNSSRGKHQTAVTTPTATPSVAAAATPSATATSTPSASPTAEASPTSTPSEAPSAAPTVTPQPTATSTATTATGCRTAGSGGSGPAAYPAEIQAGRAYNYCGPRTFVAHATDSGESATGVCAGINSSSQALPGGYRGVFFVGVDFPDRQIVSAGYTRDSAGANRDFGSIQAESGANQRGLAGGDPGAGSHTYCVNRTGSAWVMTQDGVTIFSTTDEPATSLAGATIKFDSEVQAGGSAAQQFTFTVPGFHDITVGAGGPRQLRGAAFYS